MKIVPLNDYQSQACADVCIITEGTYPYVTGGVSSWIHQIISALPELKFSILHISPASDLKITLRYKLPENVISLVNVYLHDAIIHDNPRPGKKHRDRAFQEIKNFHFDIPKQHLERFEKIFQHLCSSRSRSINTKEIIQSKESWDIIVDFYHRWGGETSFIDYFWTWRFIHIPLFQILNAEIPRARVYHTVSTGYAGLLGAIAKLKYQAPLLLTEHGIYTKERNIEISRSEWIYTESSDRIQARRSQGFFKEIWMKFFIFLGHITYSYADEIITLYGGNQEMQIRYGAPKAKCSIIPNAIKAQIFYPLREHLERNEIKKVGFVGRVVPIKDVKTFIKACKYVADRYEAVEFLVLGPTDEDEEYFKECVELVKLLDLGEKLTFYGKVDVLKYYPLLDVFVLTSISEGQPLTILEAMAVGVPCIATRVGACEELIYGRTADDQSLGVAGIVTNIGKPTETAAAIYRIISEPELHAKMVAAGYQRVERYYREETLIAQYQQHYLNYA
ncbi:GT4 family glycosyltransferase PelF [candidate division KSB1 bacterium]|nr:GT4 family glycosyltransferase PelF [candidate division KSB1 bacterium]